MIEAKQKNLAMHKLIEEIASLNGIKRILGSTVLLSKELGTKEF
jgi:UV DNA damage endonuclease